MRKYPLPKKLRWKLFSIRLGVAIIFAGLVWIGVRGLLAQPISINKVQEVDPNAANQSQAQQQAAQRMNQAANEVEQAHNTRDRDQAVANLLVAGQTYQNVSTNQPGTENVTYEAAHQAAVNELASQTQTTGSPLITVNPDGSLGLTSAGLLVAAGVPTTAADLPQNPQTPPTGNGSSYRPTTKAECESGVGSWNEADQKCYLPGETFPTSVGGPTYTVCSGKEPGSKYPYPYRATSCPTAATTPTTPVAPPSQPVNNYARCGSWGDTGCSSGTTCSYSPYGYYCVPDTVIQDSNTRNNIVETQGSKKCDGSTLKQLQGTSWVTLEICQYGCAGSKCSAPPPASKCGAGYTFNTSTNQCTTNLSPDRIDDLRVKCEGTSTSRTGKYFDQATGECVDSIAEITRVNQCDESSNRAGANMWISCSADGRKTIKYCKSSRGFDALGVCQIDQPPTPTQTCAPKEERIGCNRNSCVGQTIKMTKADCKVSYRCESDASCVTTPTTPTTPTATPSLKVGDSCSTGFFWGLVGDTCKQCPGGVSHLVGQRGQSTCGPAPAPATQNTGLNTNPITSTTYPQPTCIRSCQGNMYCVPDASGGHCVSDRNASPPSPSPKNQPQAISPTDPSRQCAERGWNWDNIRKACEPPTLLQTDDEWANTPLATVTCNDVCVRYNASGKCIKTGKGEWTATFNNAGCGATTVTNMVNSYSGQNNTPTSVYSQNYSKDDIVCGGTGPESNIDALEQNGFTLTDSISADQLASAYGDTYTTGQPVLLMVNKGSNFQHWVYVDNCRAGSNGGVNCDMHDSYNTNTQGGGDWNCNLSGGSMDCQDNNGGNLDYSMVNEDAYIFTPPQGE